MIQNLSFPYGQAPWVVEGSRPPADWPSQGEVEFRNFSVRYRPGLELVLKNLSLRVRSGEKVRMRWICAWEVSMFLMRDVGLWESKFFSPDVCSASLWVSWRCPQDPWAFP